MMLFSSLSVLTILIYLILIVLGVMFLFWGIVYFRRKTVADQALLQKLDKLIMTLDKENHNTNGNE